jgi:hypothetical protein
MKKLVWVFFLVISSNAFAQISNGFNTFLFPQGYGLKLLNSSGNSSIFNDVSNVSFMNPASLNNFNNYSTGFSYQANTNIKEAYTADFGMNRVYNFYPQSFGAVGKYQGFAFGLGFGQKYNGTKEIGPILVTTVEDPDGTGEFFNIVEENSIHNYSVSAAYSFQEILESDFDFSFGLKYSLNRFHQYVNIWNTKINSTGYYSSFAFGLTSKFILDEQKVLQLGVSYESANRFKADMEYENNPNPILHDPDPTGNHNNYAVITSTLLYTSPSELNFDLALDANEELRLLTNLSINFWEKANSNMDTQIAYTFSACYKINEVVLTSFGFYFTDYRYENNYYDLDGKFYTVFLTGGLKININRFSIDLALADSHLFSGDYTKQTIGKLALGINF